MNNIIEELYRELSMLRIDYYDDGHDDEWYRVFHMIGQLKERERHLAEAIGFPGDEEADDVLERLSRVTPRGGA